MGSRSYRRLLTILEKWPVDAEKAGGRDLGEHIRSQVPRYFPTGDALSPDAPRDAAECDADLKALEDIVNNKAKNLYAREPSQASVGSLTLGVEELKKVTSTAGLKQIGGLESENDGAVGSIASRVTGFFQRKTDDEKDVKKIPDSPS